MNASLLDRLNIAHAAVMRTGGLSPAHWLEEAAKPAEKPAVPGEALRPGSIPAAVPDRDTWGEGTAAEHGQRSLMNMLGGGPAPKRRKKVGTP